MHCFFVTSSVYQLDWSALRMGVLPFRVSELPKRVADSVVELVVGALHPVARTTRVSAAQAFRRRQVDEQSDVGDEPAGRQTIRRTHLFFGKSATVNLVGVGREKESVDQDDPALAEIGEYFPRHELGARSHEQQRFCRGSDLLLGMEEDVPDVVSDRSTPWLAHGNAGDSGCGESFGEEANLGGLPYSLGALENNEPTSWHLRKA
jgi:hypothetical protein